MTRDELITHLDALAQRTDPTAPPDFERAGGNIRCGWCKRVIRRPRRVLACGCGAREDDTREETT